MNQINGQPSVFITPTELPPEINPSTDYETRIAETVAIATEMVTEAEQAEQEWLNDPQAQQEYRDWCDWVDSQRDLEADLDDMARQAELETAESEAYEEHLEAQAAEWELSRLGDGAMHAINGSDLKWQAGVA